MEAELRETEHIIAYLDFLGAKKRIIDNDGVFLKELSYIYTKANNNCEKVNKDFNKAKIPPIKYQIFSDNIVFAQEINDENMVYQVFNFILFVSAYLHQALLSGFLVRGGITIGDVCINETFVSGKALLKAYQLESQVAIYPRVIIDFDVFGRLTLLDDKILNLLSISIGDDFLYCIDAFRVIYKPPGFTISYEKIREAILKICKFEKDIRIMQKHLWVITQFNDFCTINKNEEYKIDVLKEYANVAQLTSV